MILGAVDYSAAVSLIVLMLSGGAGATWLVIRKAKPEAEAIGIKSLIEVNGELRGEVKRLTGIVAEQRVEIEGQGKQIRDQAQELATMESSTGALRRELDDLESRLGELGN